MLSVFAVYDYPHVDQVLKFGSNIFVGQIIKRIKKQTIVQFPIAMFFSGVLVCDIGIEIKYKPYCCRDEF